MAFRDNIAPQRKNPIEDKVGVAPALEIKSNQERTIGQASKFRTVSFAPKESQHVGNQVRVQTNNKGTGIVGRPSSIGEVVRDTTRPATENPSGTRNQTTKRFR